MRIFKTCSFVNVPRELFSYGDSPGYPVARGPLGPLGLDFAQHRQTLRPSVDGIRSKALRPFGL